MNNNYNVDYIPKQSRINKNKREIVVKRRIKRIKIKWVLLLLFIFIGIILYSLYKIFNWGVDNKKTSDITKRIEEVTNVV